MGAGAWPFLVGGVICLVKSDNERDLYLFTSNIYMRIHWGEATCFVGFSQNVYDSSSKKYNRCIAEPGEARGKNRSVMPLDVRGCTRVTMRWPIRLTCQTTKPERVRKSKKHPIIGTVL